MELLTNLKQAVQGLKQVPWQFCGFWGSMAMPGEVAKENLIPVDLLDMSEFITAVQNRFVFQSCVSRCSFRVSGTRVNVEMTERNWGRTNDPDSDLTSLAYEVKGILANQQRHRSGR